MQIRGESRSLYFCLCLDGGGRPLLARLILRFSQAGRRAAACQVVCKQRLKGFWALLAQDMHLLSCFFGLRSQKCVSH